MKKIKIITKTDKGEDALKKHVHESLQMNRIKKLLQKKMGINQEVTSQEPYIVEVWATPGSPFNMSFRKPKQVVEELTDTMTLNGATLDIDYVVEILNE